MRNIDTFAVIGGSALRLSGRATGRGRIQGDHIRL